MSLQTSAARTLPPLPMADAAVPSSTSEPSVPDPGGTRSPREDIPSTVRNATLDYTGPAPNTVYLATAPQRRIVTGADLNALISVLNALPALPPGTYTCTIDDGEQAVLTMVRRQFTIELSGCRQVSVVVDGVSQPLLQASLTQSLSMAIHRLLGATSIGNHGTEPSAQSSQG